MKNIFEIPDDNISFDSSLKKGSNLSEIIYKPDFSKMKGSKYHSVIRFVPYFNRDGELAESSVIEKYVHYIHVEENSPLNGYYDCMTNFPKGKNKCPLCNLYFNLKESTDPAKIELSKKLPRKIRYYSYIQIVKEPQQPELEGKLMVYPFSFKIRELIEKEKNGTMGGKKVNPYDLANGKNLNIVLGKDNPYDYSNCYFDEKITPISLDGAPIKTVLNPNNGKFVIDASETERLLKFLTTRDYELNELIPKEWDFSTTEKVEKIVSFYKNGEDFKKANDYIDRSKYKTTYSSTYSYEEKNDELESQKTTKNGKSSTKSLIDSFFEEED